MPVRAILVDAFGTIVHAHPRWEERREDCLRAVHATWQAAPPVTFERFLASYEQARGRQHACVQDGWREFDFAARFAGAMAGCGAPGAAAEAWGPVADERYHRFQQDLIHPYDEPWEALAALRRAGHRLALVSNYGHGGTLRESLHKLDLLDHFDAVVVSADVGRMKPHPRIYEAALDELGVRAQDAVMVGNDLECDVMGAKRAGVRAVWAPYPRESPAPDHPAADAVVARLAELPEVVARL